jgi:hypothetical protein
MEDLMSRTYSPAKLGLAIWFPALALAFGAQEMSAATVTHIVGTCKSGTQFKTIQSALDASPAPNTDADGDLIAAVAQVYVNNVSGGSVNLTNLQVNGMGYGSAADFFVGIFYEGSLGTINQVITSSQNNNSATNVTGFGMWIQGGSSKPSVTVENSSMHDFTQCGLYAVGTTTAPDLTVTIKNNNVSSALQTSYNLVVEEGTDPTVSGNVVNGGYTGIYIDAPTGSITGNTVLGSLLGITLVADGPSVKSNSIFNTIDYGIYVATSIKASEVESNTIRTVNQPGSLDVTGTGIDLGCNSVSSSKVNSNTLMDLNYGYGDAPAGFGGSNTYVGVVSDVATCTSDNVSKKASAAARLKLLGQSRGQ